MKINLILKISITFLIIFLLQFLLTNCGLNPVPAPNVISGSDNLYALKNQDATFTFQGNEDTYGTFQLRAYVSTASIMTPQGGGVQKSPDNLSVAPESGYNSSEECGYYYYYMITDMDPHYAKVFIHTITQNEDGITIEFNWWLQTQKGERNF